MIFTLVPTAMAEGEKVAKVGDVEYETLAAAINAAGTGGTVKLLADITGQTVIPAEKDIVLDLNGKTMTHTGTTLYNSGKLTVRDSSDDKSGKIVSTGNVGIGVNHDSTTTIEYANIEAVEGAVITGYATGAEITIQNGIFVASDNAVIAGNGNSTDHNGAERKNANTITINGGKFTGNIKTTGYIACGIYAPWKDIVTVNGGEFTVNNGIGIVARAGQVKVNGGTFTCTGSAEGKVGDKNFDMAAAQCLYFDATDPAYPAYNSETDYIKVTGGTFSSNVSAYVADGYIQNENGVVETLGETNAVAKVGDTYYKTLAEAVAAAKNDETVTLLKNAETTVELSFTNKAITLDLNGKTVSGTFTDNFSVIEAGADASLTVQDTSVAGTGKIASNKYGISARDGGALIVKSGTIESEYAPLSGNNTAGDMNFTVNGGTLTAKHGPAIYMPGQVNLSITDGVLNGGISLRMGQVSISGGTINAATDGLDSPAEYYHYSGNAWLPDALYVFGGTYTSENTTYGNSLHLNITGGTFNCANGQGSAVAIYDLGKVEQVMEITISDEAKLGTNSTARNAYDKLSLSDIGVTSPKPGFGAHSGQVSTTITGGLFSSDPSAYVPATHHVEDSGNGSYPFAVKEGAKSDATIIVTAATNAAVSDTIESGDKAKIEAVKDKANVEGMAAAIRDDKKAAIAKAAGVTDGQLAGKNMIETEITVKVEAKAADLAKGKLTFEASPVATVKVNGAATGTTVPVTNDMLNGQPITVKLPLPAGFTPKQILHKFTGGGYEYFINETEGSKRGAGSFKIEDNCAVFTIYGFSTFELSGTVTYVAPSYSSGSSSSDPTYAVSAPSKTENGSVTVSPKSASKGDTVTVTVKPDSGYVLETLTVTDKNGNELTLKDKGDGKYTFTMPAGKVEVKATFMEDNSMLNFFYDVPNNAYFYEAVKWAVKNGITTGVGNDLFAPEQPCTRAQIVTFLWRAAGSPEPKTASSFTDVPANAYYAKAVAWAVENGITNGMTETTFAPDATCTRGQSVTFLHRALKGTASSSANFTDVKSDAFYADAINWAVANNVTNGTSNTTFSPNADCTRAEIVTFLYRAYQGK